MGLTFVGDNPEDQIIARFKDEVRKPLLDYIKSEGGVIFMSVNTHSITDRSINGKTLQYDGDINGLGVPQVHELTYEFVASDDMGPNIGFSILNYVETKKHNVPILAEIAKISESMANAPNEGNRAKLEQDIRNKKKLLRRFEQVKLNDGLRVVNTIDVMGKTEANDLGLRYLVNKGGVAPANFASGDFIHTTSSPANKQEVAAAAR